VGLGNNVKVLQRINSSCRRIVWLSVCILSSFCGSHSWALDPDQFQKQSAFDGMELEDLMGLSISSLSKHREPVSKAAAAVFVLTGEEIRRSPVTNLIEALRLIPGLNIQRINNTEFYVTIRGLNGPFPHHLLVMIDGRSIYNPQYAGVYWDQRDLPLAIIDRIEVVRGPGGAIWGSNALNGVINIITKSSNLQQGTEVLLQAGASEQQLTAISGGGTVSAEKTAMWRFFADDHRYADTASGDGIRDQGRMSRVGGRFDHALSQFEWQGDVQYYRADTYRKENVFSGEDDFQPLNVPVDVEGVSLNSTISQQLVNNAQWDVQLFAEYYDRDMGTLGREQQKTADVSGQYRFLRGRHHITVGGNYRGYFGEFTDTETISFGSSGEYNSLVSSFIQDQVSLTDQWMLTVGAKYEWHRFQDGFLQPTMRLSWSNDDLTYWMAFSKAVQAQTRDSRWVNWKLLCYCDKSSLDLLLFVGPETASDLVANLSIDPSKPTSIIYVLEGEPDNTLESQLFAWESGIRWSLGGGLMFDFSAYSHRYTNMVTTAPHEIRRIDDGNGSMNILEQVARFGEYADVNSKGIDAVLSWRGGAGVSWRLAYSTFDVDVQNLDGMATSLAQSEFIDPQQQMSVHVDWTISRRWQMNAFIRRVGFAPYGNAWEPIKAYTTVDSKVVFEVLPEFDVFLVGKNLFDSGHVEGRRTSGQPDIETEVERSVTLGVSLTL